MIRVSVELTTPSSFTSPQFIGQNPDVSIFPLLERYDRHAEEDREFLPSRAKTATLLPDIPGLRSRQGTRKHGQQWRPSPIIRDESKAWVKTRLKKGPGNGKS
jgi:hypothetical protein